MKRLLNLIREELLIPNTFLTTYMQGNTTLISNPDQQITVRYADVPLYSEGVPTYRTYIRLSTDRDMPHPVIPNLVESRFFIDIYSDRAFSVCEDLFFNMDSSVISKYGSPQGIRTILQARPYSLDADIHIERFLQIGGPRYEIDEASKLWFMTTQWEAFVVTTAQMQYS